MNATTETAYPRICEYGQANRNGWPVAAQTIMDTGTFFNPHGCLRNLRVVAVTAGYEPAGSMLRWTDGYVTCRIDYPDGTRGGQRFVGPNAESDARALFAKLMGNAPARIGGAA